MSGPPEVTFANFTTLEVKMDQDLVLLTQTSATRSCGGTYVSHTNGDLYTLTPAGKEAHALNGSKVVLRITKSCTGSSSRASRKLKALSHYAHRQPNCRRQCGGYGACTKTCAFAAGSVSRTKPLHTASLFLKEEVTVENLVCGAITVSLIGSYVPLGETWEVCPHC